MMLLTRIKLANADKRILRLLRESRFYNVNKNKDNYKMSLNDIDRSEKWINEVEKFINIAWTERFNKTLFEKFNLSKKDLVDFYILMTIATLPNPIFKTSRARLSHTLVGSSIYQEPKKHLFACLQSLGNNNNTEEQLQFGHRYASDVMIYASELKFAHEIAYGNITLEEAL